MTSEYDGNNNYPDRDNYFLIYLGLILFLLFLISLCVLAELSNRI